MFIDSPIRPVSPAYAEKCYRSAMGPGSKNRSIYCQVFTRAISALRGLLEVPASDRLAKLKVLNDNLALWESLVADLRTSKEQAATEFIARVISLKGFVAEQTKKIKAGAGSISALVDINETVLAGLSGSGNDKAETHPAPEARMIAAI